MKKIVFIFVIALAAAVGACSDNKQPAAKAEEAHDAHVHEAGADSTAVAAYICPMKCEGSASDKPGKCPVCKMDLVAVEQEAATEK